MVIKISNTKVNFDSLPEKYKTVVIRRFFDKDGSGWLELKNKNNENEIVLFEKAFGISLKKYYVNKTAYDEGGIGFSQTYSGQYGTAIHHSKRDNIWGKDLSETTETDTILNKNGKIVYTGYHHYTPNDHENCYGSSHLYTKKQLTKGKYNLVEQADSKSFYEQAGYLNGDKYVSTGKIPPGIQYEHDRFGNVKKKYYLNGEEVKAKLVAKGIYEITKENGEIFYISANGNNNGKRITTESARKITEYENLPWYKKIF